jgi:hypothetical protein
VFAARAVPPIQVRELGAQEGGLQAVQTLVVAQPDVLASASLTDIAQLPDLPGQLPVACAHGSCLS